jgi:hypothetical protein
MANPSKLTPAVRQTILENLAAGATVQASCLAAGIARQTFYDWRAKAEAGESPFVEFFAAVEQAEAQAQVERVTVIRQAMADSWQAAAWWLERRFPEDWGRRERHEHSSPAGNPLKVQVEGADTAARLEPYLPAITELVERWYATQSPDGDPPALDGGDFRDA